MTYNLIGSTRFDLPWQITGIRVVFSKPIATADVNSLTGLSTTGLSGLGTKTLTWTISTITQGSFATSCSARAPTPSKTPPVTHCSAGAVQPELQGALRRFQR